jgi:hypothetical protein
LISAALVYLSQSTQGTQRVFAKNFWVIFSVISVGSVR